MKHILRTVCLTVLLALLTVPAGAADADKAGPNDNKPPEGFQALFNGKDLTNWKGLVTIKERDTIKGEALETLQSKRNEQIQGHWTVKDGILTYDGKAKTSLQTARDYGNFELRIDWKIAPEGDSGLYLRGQPQVQIWDSDRAKGARGEDKGSGSGGLWNNPPDSKGKMPLKKADKPVGEWNSFRIIMKGDKTTVYLNGELVVDDAPLANYWEKGKPLPTKGPIELQDHGDPLWFKNIYIKELPD